MVASMRWTIADLAVLPNLREDCRYEIIDGELHVSSQPDWRHQVLGDTIVSALNAWGVRAGKGLAVSAPGVIFSPENAVAPDVVWVRRERFAAVLGHDGKLHAAPDLMVEILSPGTTNIHRDREAKMDLYSRWGVLEYWIVDWRPRRLEVYRRQETQLCVVGTLSEDDFVRSPNLPGFSATLGDLLAQIPEDVGDAPATEEDDDGA